MPKVRVMRHGSLVNALYGGAGIPTFPAAAVAANGVSMAEVIRNLSERQSPRLATHTKADVTAATAWTTANSPVALFTVTGDVLVQCFAVVTTNMTSTGGTGTLSVGIVGNTAGLLVLDTVDGTAFQAGDVWTLITAADDGLGQVADEWAFIGNGADINVSIATNNMTAGGMTVYCWYIPVSPAATVVTT